MSLLTDADKLNLVNQHIKSLDFQIYNAQLDLIEANAESPANSENVSAINTRLTALNAKRTVLEAEAAQFEVE